jgi:murein L,D-transpeptidase YafK
MKAAAILVLALCLGGLAVWLAGIDRTQPLTGTADLVVIDKAQRRLTLYQRGIAMRSYRVALGSQPVGPKERAGDGRTPEGSYVVDFRKPDSAFHRALHLSYPNAQDLARARVLGVAPGGDIMIHGIRNGLGWIGPLQRRLDWTRGCIAVTDTEIEQIWDAVPDGTTVEIRP